ncbi:YggT family protein [Candidatus Berkelbacteria bacterium]|nr:YggT family protein [Candidatus Berkelbacteria bacterium]
MLFLRFLLALFGARQVAFTDFINALTGPFVAPFKGLFASPRVEGGFFDSATFSAALVVFVFGWIIAALIESVAINEET